MDCSVVNPKEFSPKEYQNTNYLNNLKLLGCVFSIQMLIRV